MIWIPKNLQAATFYNILLRRSNYIGRCKTLCWLNHFNVTTDSFSLWQKSADFATHWLSHFSGWALPGVLQIPCLAITAREISLICPCLLPTRLTAGLSISQPVGGASVVWKSGKGLVQAVLESSKRRQRSNRGGGCVPRTCDRDES